MERIIGILLILLGGFSFFWGKKVIDEKKVKFYNHYRPRLTPVQLKHNYAVLFGVTVITVSIVLMFLGVQVLLGNMPQ